MSGYNGQISWAGIGCLLLPWFAWKSGKYLFSDALMSGHLKQGLFFPDYSSTALFCQLTQYVLYVKVNFLF
jgi:hypothetical protein